MTRKKITVFGLIGLISLIGPIGLVVLAQEGIFGVRDLGVEHVGLLTSNPFYFLKELRRDVKKLFTFKELRKLELDLDVVNEKAAEIKKLQEINPDDKELQRAITNYGAYLQTIKMRFEGLRGTAQNSNIDRLLEKFMEMSVKHYVVLHTVAGSDGIRNLLVETIALVAQRFDVPEQFVDRLTRATRKLPQGELQELRVAELLERLDNKLHPSVRQLLLPLRDELFVALSGRLDSLLLISPLEAIFASWSGDQLFLLRLLDEVRERVLQNDLKTELNLFRQRLLERIEEEQGIAKEDAQAAMDAAQALLTQLEQKLAGAGTVPQSMKQLLEHAKFAYNQAVMLLKEGNYGGAYGQATASAAAARNALVQLQLRVQDYQRILARFKDQFDRLSGEIRGLVLTPADAPRLFMLLSEAEKRIVEAASEKSLGGIRVIQSLLAAIEELIRVVK